MPQDTLAPRLVLDTNVVIAGLLWDGPSRHLFDLAINKTIELSSSPMLLAELANALGYAKFATRIENFGTSIQELVASYAAMVSLIIPATVLRVVLNDEDDDHVIAAAVAARANWIVTGDRKHLLPIGSHQGIAIITPREALNRFGTRTDG